MTLLRGNKECVEILENLLAMTQKLSEWEIEFINDLNRKLANGDTLSHKQKLKLCEIWERI